LCFVKSILGAQKGGAIHEALAEFKLNGNITFLDTD